MPLRKEILNVASRLIEFESVTGNMDQISACIDYIKNYFAHTSVSIAEHCFKGHPALFISFNGKKNQDVILNGHIDVVEGHSTQFHPFIEDGKLYGRGSNDMKSSVAVFMVLMKELASQKDPPKVGLMIVSDEESTGNGTKMMVRAGYRSKFVLCGEPTRLRIETKHKGTLVVRVTAYGSHSHGSRPWQGVNAIDKLIRQYRKLLAEVPQATTSRKWLPTINPSGIHAEGPFNVTPAKAVMVLDIRTTEDFTNRKMKALLKSVGMKYSVIVEGGMLLNPIKSKPIRLLRKIAHKQLGKKHPYVKSCGSSDMKFFSDKGITAVNFGPFGKNHHKSNEYVEVGSLLPYYSIVHDFVHQCQPYL